MSYYCLKYEEKEMNNKRGCLVYSCQGSLEGFWYHTVFLPSSTGASLVLDVRIYSRDLNSQSKIIIS